MLGALLIRNCYGLKVVALPLHGCVTLSGNTTSTNKTMRLHNHVFAKTLFWRKHESCFIQKYQNNVCDYSHVRNYSAQLCQGRAKPLRNRSAACELFDFRPPGFLLFFRTAVFFQPKVLKEVSDRTCKDQNVGRLAQRNEHCSS